jgi:hypothetical protein
MVYGVGPKGERHRINININIHREIWPQNRDEPPLQQSWADPCECWDYDGLMCNQIFKIFFVFLGVYLTNPLEIVPVSIIEQQLCSESVLLVRRSDVLTRWTDDCDLSRLIEVEDSRWREMNVLGTVCILSF